MLKQGYRLSRRIENLTPMQVDFIVKAEQYYEAAQERENVEALQWELLKKRGDAMKVY